MRLVKSLIYYLITYQYYKLIFGKIGRRSRIFKTLRIESAHNIYIGSKVTIYGFSWIAATPLTNAKECKLIINDGVSIGHFSHIYATSKIEIGPNVLIADKVYISDNLHAYQDISLPVMNQPIKQINTVAIGDGAWLGENVCVIGASIGKGAVIGANSVVTKDIPDYCVAVGSPAKVIKRYNFQLSKWEKVNDD
ncbi:acyltransferase [Mucilaginibacter pallidiroseus]|uniref:Acyltransferase n=1 Tax=Mucilaginibacter pallidiroseus TaxID=2599295 RepID=A0A563UIP3_9SPHI|nr:acyltransferase [Mucilaginibacter pallidiroseus]TWR31176.1 acyltransferase [Mucilaginibacter pallidiroseus]